MATLQEPVHPKKDSLFSLLKGIGIALVVIGHSGCPDAIRDFIYAFHMPLFFIISGYLFKKIYFQNKSDFIKKRLRSLYTPFVTWSIIFIVLHNVFYNLNLINNSYGFQGKIYHAYSLKELFIQVFKSLIFINAEPFLGAYWFIKALFFGSLIFLFFHSKIKNPYTLPICSILIVISRTLCINQGILPFNGETLHQSLLASFFISVGSLIKEKNFQPSRIHLFFFLTVLLVLSQVTSISMGQEFLSSLLLPLSGIFGFFVLRGICTKINERDSVFKNGLIRLGDCSLYILTFHFLMFKPISLLKIHLYGLPQLQIGEFPVIMDNNSFFWILYAVFSIITSYFLGVLVMKIKKNFWI